MIENNLHLEYQKELTDIEKETKLFKVAKNELDIKLENIKFHYLKKLYEQANFIDKALACLINFFECITGKHYYTTPENELIMGVEKIKLLFNRAHPLQKQTDFKQELKNLEHCDRQDIFKTNFDASGLSPREILDVIFDTQVKSLPRSIEAFKESFPKFEYTRLDHARIAIATDDKHLLHNSAILAKLAPLDYDSHEFEVCCDYAYESYHPRIYMLPKKPVLPNEYTLNFMWVNLNPQDRTKDEAQHIFGEGLNLSENDDRIAHPQILRELESKELSLGEDERAQWQEMKKSFIYRLSLWADKHPRVDINLWYDSALVTQKARQKTHAILEKIAQSRNVTIQLRDLRSLLVDEMSVFISHPGIPVYHRIDYYKALIADHMMDSTQEQAKYCVVSDIDIEPMSPQHLFDQRTQVNLSSYGYIFQRKHGGIEDYSFENSFFIFNSKKEGVRQSHYEAIIKNTIETMNLARRKPPYPYSSENVFGKYYFFLKDKKPRKVVACPLSSFSKTSSVIYGECFAFNAEGNILTSQGRAGSGTDKPKQLFPDWKPEPLLPL